VKKLWLIFFCILLACASSHRITLNPFEDTRKRWDLPQSIQADDHWAESKRVLSLEDLCWEGMPPAKGETWNYGDFQIDYTWLAEVYLFPAIPSSKISAGDLQVKMKLTFKTGKYRYLHFSVDGLTYDESAKSRCEVLILAQTPEGRAYCWACLPVVSSTRAKSGLATFLNEDLKNLKATAIVVVVQDDLTGKTKKGVISID